MEKRRQLARFPFRDRDAFVIAPWFFLVKKKKRMFALQEKQPENGGGGLFSPLVPR